MMGEWIWGKIWKNMEKQQRWWTKSQNLKIKKKRILRNLNPDPKCYNPPTPDRTLSLAIHSPTVLSGFSAQITNQDQTLFSFYPGGCDCSHNIAQTSAGKRRADPAFSKRSSVSTSICILGMEWEPWYVPWFRTEGTKIKYIRYSISVSGKPAQSLCIVS